MISVVHNQYTDTLPGTPGWFPPRIRGRFCLLIIWMNEKHCAFHEECILPEYIPPPGIGDSKLSQVYFLILEFWIAAVFDNKIHLFYNYKKVFGG